MGFDAGWIQLEIQRATPGSGQTTIVSSQRGLNLAGDGSFGIAGDCSSLPVELVSFDATRHSESVLLEWETASELDNSGFELQRAEGEGEFQKIAFIDGGGTTNESERYRYEDASVRPNVQYRYRLKQLDFDGTFAFSAVVEVFTEDPSRVALSEFYPNPANSGQATVEINVADAVDASIEVFDIRGALLESRSEVLDAGTNRLTLDTSRFTPGSHFAKIQIGDRALYRQFVVTR